MIDRNQNIENSKWRRICRSQVVSISTWLKEGVEHGWIVNNCLDIFHLIIIQHHIRHSCVLRCQNSHGCCLIVGRGWKNSLIHLNQINIAKIAIKYKSNSWKRYDKCRDIKIDFWIIYDKIKNYKFIKSDLIINNFVN